MAERVLRGMRIGANSMETTEGVTFADRIEATYECNNAHAFTVTFAIEAELPAEWECRCGEMAALKGSSLPEPKKPMRPARTHWDMLLERRSIPELEKLLDEQLAALREGRLRFNDYYRKSA